jgi:uroporphyrinogen-III synthase
MWGILPLRIADAVVLASGSACRSLAAAGGAGGGAMLVCIGPKTAKVAREVGLKVGLVADETTSDGIIQASWTSSGTGRDVVPLGCARGAPGRAGRSGRAA